MDPNEMNEMHYQFPIMLSIQFLASFWFQFFISEIFMS